MSLFYLQVKGRDVLVLRGANVRHIQHNRDCKTLCEFHLY